MKKEVFAEGNLEKYLIVCLVTFVSLFFTQNSHAQEVMNLYPIDDATVQLYDEDAVVGWNDARNFNGVIFRDPIEQHSGNDADKVSVRSDNGVGTYRIYRHSQLFDMIDVPTNATIETVTLNLFGTPENTNNSTSLVITSHTREDNEMLQKQDWPIFNFGPDEFSRSVIQIGQYTPYNFGAEGVEYVQSRVGDELVLGIMTEFDFDDIVPGSIARSGGFNSIEALGTSSDPYLEIIYTVPDVATSTINREEFLAILETAIEGESKRDKRFIQRLANRIFNKYEDGKYRQAAVRLKIFKQVILFAQVNDSALDGAIVQLRQQIKDERS